MPNTPHLVAVLRIVDPSGQQQFALVDRPALQIGSATDECGLTLTGPGICAIHCTLRWQNTRWVVFDRGAPTGTYINSRRCNEPTALCPGDRISIVHHLIHFSTLPSLELPHVLARLRDSPIRWLPGHAPATSPHTPPAPRKRTSSRLLVCLALSAGLALAASIGEAETSGPSATPAAPSPDLSPGTSSSSASNLSPGTSSPPAPTYVSEPPTFELPPDAVGLGRPTDGAILHALQLPPAPDYTIRCPAHAHGTSATIGELMHALARMRNLGYRGELVVGDISRLDGGQYGPHKSHQSGRDVDIWLPIRGGRYARGCPRCTTDLCRPEPGQVDWRATWQLVQSLAERGAVEDIFLDWSLHPKLAQAASDLGVPDAEVLRQIQHPFRGRPTLIKHSDGHVHHMHVRFRDPPATDR